MRSKDVEAYVGQHGRVTLTDLSRRFGASVPMMRDVTARLVRKGRLERHELMTHCGSCGEKAGCAASEYYTKTA